MAAAKEPGKALVASPQQMQVALYDKIADPMSYWSNKELALAAASLLNAPPAQGPAILMHAMARNVDLFALARDYDWIMGKPAMKASAMLSNFRLNYGGKYEIVESSPNRAAIKLTQADGSVIEREMTRRDLLQSRWPWKKDDGGWRARVKEVNELLAGGAAVDDVWVKMYPYFGDNYGTPEDWENMLWNRLVSKSLRKVCPELVSGVYTPEEMRDVIDVESTVVAKNPVTAEEFAAQQALIREQTEAAQQKVIDAEYEPVAAAPPQQPPTSTTTGAAAPGPDDPGSCSETQRQEIERLFDACNLSQEQREGALKKRNANVTHNLSKNAAADLLNVLAGLHRQQQEAAAAGN